jgi:hypothetical protein
VQRVSGEGSFTGDPGRYVKPLNADLNPICHLLALLGAHPILHISKIRVKKGSRYGHISPKGPLYVQGKPGIRSVGGIYHGL